MDFWTVGHVSMCKKRCPLAHSSIWFQKKKHYLKELLKKKNKKWYQLFSHLSWVSGEVSFLKKAFCNLFWLVFFKTLPQLPWSWQRLPWRRLHRRHGSPWARTSSRNTTCNTTPRRGGSRFAAPAFYCKNRIWSILCGICCCWPWPPQQHTRRCCILGILHVEQAWKAFSKLVLQTNERKRGERGKDLIDVVVSKWSDSGFGVRCCFLG